MATISEVAQSPGGRYNNMVVNGLFQPRRLSHALITADITLEENDSGKIYFVGSNGVDITLPATPKFGLNYCFIADADYATAVNKITVNGLGEFFIGSIVAADGGAGVTFNGTSHDVVQWDAAYVEGDMVCVVSNGTQWFVSGHMSVTNSFSGATS